MQNYLLLPFQKTGRKILRTIQGLMQSGYTMGEIQSLIAKVKHEGTAEKDVEAWRKEMPLLSVENDPVFRELKPWSGDVPSGFGVDFTGQIIDGSFIGSGSPLASPPKDSIPSHHDTAYPSVSEETFEWQFLLSAILEAGQSFTMIEAGAGFGRWSIAAACALRQRAPSLPFHLCAIEAEPQHFEWLRQHFKNNGVEPEHHRLIQAAIAANDGEAFFVIGNAQEWYGQAVVSSSDYQMRGMPESQTVTVPALSIESLLADFERVDFMDFDIQGAEGTAIRAGIRAMTRKVKRAFVATHSSEIDHELPKLFRHAGWYSTSLYRCNESQLTPFGEVSFQDGAQCWMNPNIL